MDSFANKCFVRALVVVKEFLAMCQTTQVLLPDAEHNGPIVEEH